MQAEKETELEDFKYTSVITSDDAGTLRRLHLDFQEACMFRPTSSHISEGRGWLLAFFWISEILRHLKVRVHQI